jgi:hypothetical protein
MSPARLNWVSHAGVTSVEIKPEVGVNAASAMFDVVSGGTAFV